MSCPAQLELNGQKKVISAELCNWYIYTGNTIYMTTDINLLPNSISEYYASEYYTFSH